MTTKFQVGQECKINAVEFITVSRRTEVSVWFIQNGKEFRRKIQISGYGENSQEFVNFQGLSLYAIKTPQTINETPNEPQDVAESVTESQESVTTITSTERRALIDSFNHYATMLHNLDYGSPEYDEIWEKMLKINDEIKNLDAPNEVPQTPNETLNESQTTLNEPQDVYCVYEVSTIEGLETDLTPEYCVYEVTSYSPEGAIEIVRHRLTLQNTRFNILGVCEAQTTGVVNDEWLEF